MKKMLLSLFLISIFAAMSSAQDLPCEKVVSYQINARLDAVEKTVSGDMVLNWTNTGTAATQELYFHLYLNAFKNTQSTFFKEIAKRGDYGNRLISRFQKGGWGYCHIETISASNTKFQSTALSPVFVQPDDNNKADETVFKVDLPEPVAPGESVTLNISFLSQLPHRAPRTGYNEDYFFVAQWFPKIGVWQNDTWHCNQFHALGEFFADYGDYDVQLTVPSEFVVGACGVKTDSTSNNDGTITHRFQEQCIHDFAWTAWPQFKTATRLFEHPELPTVKMQLLYQPEHQRYVDDFFGGTENTLKYLGLWYVPYPYSTITIVDARWRSSSSGMEYPTLFTTGVDWLAARGSQRPLGLTVHECAHQFFYGIIGTNEVEHPWMDEGFTTYATSRCMNTAYGDGAYSKSYLERDGFYIPVTFSNVPKDQRDWIVENNRERSGREVMNKAD